MVNIIIVEKSGFLKEVNVKDTSEEYLSKKAGFKNHKDFEKKTIWDIDGVFDIVLYGKTVGRAGQENKYDFPPPVDNTLFFGPCVLLCVKENKILDLTEKKWKVIYEKLFGGFEDIEEDSEEEEEDEDDIPKTKEGYAKDGFVVEEVEDDEDEDEDEEEHEDDDEDVEDDEDEDDDKEEEEKPKPRKQPKRKVKSESKQNIFAKLEIDDEYLNCESELEEEDYL
jgi:hypothetical protein